MPQLVDHAIGGAELPILDRPSAFVHACVHAVTGAMVRLGSLRDVVVIGRSLSTAELHEALELARTAKYRHLEKLLRDRGAR